MATIGSLSVKLGLVTVEWDAATEKAKRQAKDLQSAFNDLGGKFGFLTNAWRQFGGALSAVSLGAIIQQTIAFTDEISDLAKGFDLTISQTLNFRDALISAGANADGASKIMSTLFSKIDDARQGNDKMVGQFEKLGITFKDIKELAPYDAIQRVAKGFQNINDTFERTKAIKEFFGKQGIGMSVEALNEVLAQGADRYDKYAEKIERVGEINDNLKRSYDNLKIAVAEIMGTFSGGGVVSADRFSQILKAIAAGAITAGVLSLVTAFGSLALAIRAATVAGAGFNLIAGATSPLGIAIKLLAAGAAAIVFIKSGPEAEKKGHPDFEKKIGTVVMAGDEPATTDAGGKPAESTELTKQAQQRQAAVGLTRQLTKLDAERQAIMKDVENSELVQNQLALNNISLREKLLNIDTKLKQELIQLNDEGSSGQRAQAVAAADAERARVRQEASANASIIVTKKQLEMKQQLVKAEEDYLRALGDTGADSEQETPGQQRAAEEERQRARFNMNNQVKEAARLVDLENERTKFMMRNGNLSERELDSAMARYDLEARIQEYRREAQSKGETNQTAINAHVQLMRQAGEEVIRLKEQTADAQRTFEFGWNKAFQQYADSASNAATVGRDMFNSVTGNMSAAINTFVQTGKFAFKDFARSVIRDLIAIQMRAAAMRLFSGLLGGSTAPGGSNDGWFKNVYMAAEPKAMGGPVDAGSPYMVGEVGPELFVPNKSGSIIPNNKLAATMNASQPQVVYNGPYIASMSAIDTQSGMQFLMKNKQSIWAANQSAQRSLPVSK
jgi:lambda family phage tail tape measure protein